MMATPKKVLVIDDDKTIHAVLRHAFTNAGYQVSSALDAMQGLMMAKQLKPDLIVLDMAMPAGGGSSVYERLQLMSDSFQVPFLIYSGKSLAEVRELIPEAPNMEVLNKTAKIDEVLAAAARLTGS